MTFLLFVSIKFMIFTQFLFGRPICHKVNEVVIGTEIHKEEPVRYLIQNAPKIPYTGYFLVRL